MSRMYKAEVTFVPGNRLRLDFEPFKATYTWTEEEKEKPADASTILEKLRQSFSGTGIVPALVGYIVNVA